MAHHAVLNVAKLQEVLPELVVADLALHNPDLPQRTACEQGSGHRAQTPVAHRAANEHLPRQGAAAAGVLRYGGLGLDLLAVDQVLPLLQPRPCGVSAPAAAQAWQIAGPLTGAGFLAPPGTAARAAGPHTSQSQSPAPPSARSRSPLPCVPGARKRAATAAHPSAQAARGAYHCRQYSSSVSLVVLLSRPPRNSLPSTNSWSMRGRGPPDAPCGRATPP